MPRASSGLPTPLEIGALVLSANGLTSRQIAARVGVSKTAVDVRLGRAARVLGARSRTHAVAVALRLGLIGLDEVRLPEGVGGAVPVPAQPPPTPSAELTDSRCHNSP